MSHRYRIMNKFRASKKIERFLSPAELARPAPVLAGAAALGVESPFALVAICVLMLVGCRRNEILTLKRVHVDHFHRCLRLPRQQDRFEIRSYGYGRDARDRCASAFRPGLDRRLRRAASPVVLQTGDVAEGTS